MNRDCAKLIELCFAYLDGELEDKKLEMVLRLLEERVCCRHCHETLRQTRELLSRMPSPELPAELKERLKGCLKKR